MFLLVDSMVTDIPALMFTLQFPLVGLCDDRIMFIWIIISPGRFWLPLFNLAGSIHIGSLLNNLIGVGLMEVFPSLFLRDTL